MQDSKIEENLIVESLGSRQKKKRSKESEQESKNIIEEKGET